ncbi:MAG: UDP-3-O-acyl-N-acetylglucosamine deacetylase [Prochlorothrix sp.]
MIATQTHPQADPDPNTLAPLPTGLTSSASDPWARQPPSQQQTLKTEVCRSGVGLHHGQTTQVRLKPAPPHQGRQFVRVDLPHCPPIAADLTTIHPTLLSTELVAGDAAVRTVEHLLAALVGLGVSNVTIEVDGGEIPLLDGSAQGWVAAIAEAGIQTQEAAVTPAIVLSEPISVQDGDSFVVGLPARETRFTYGLDFPDLPAIGNQWHSWVWTPATFAESIAPARTFGFAEQVESLRAQGLIQRGSLENALVCSREGWVNPPLRFENEPVRHKLLDLLGDLSLLGSLPRAHILAHRAGHQMHLEFAQRAIAAQT